MLSSCTEPGCATLVLGVGTCLAHQTTSTQQFARGRPFIHPSAPVEAVTGALSVPPATPAALPFENAR
jgi:hypothetical protein